MNARSFNLLMMVLAFVLVVSASNTSSGAIVVRQDCPLVGEADPDLVGLLATELLDCGDLTDSLAGPAPVSSDPSHEEDGPPTLQHLEHLLVAAPTGCQPDSVSQSNGGGSGNSAIPSSTCHVPEPALQSRLPREARPYLATGPPFELLRPPRRLTV